MKAWKELPLDWNDQTFTGETFVDGGKERRGKSLNLTACFSIYGWWMRRIRKGL